MIAVYYTGSYGNIHHLEKVPVNFTIDRPNGLECYTFLHFIEPVKLLTKDGIVQTTPNACLVYPPSVPQYFTCETSVSHNWFHFDKESAKIFEACGMEYSKVYYPQNCDFITDIIRSIEIEWQTNKMYFDLMANAKIGELFVLLARECSSLSTFAVEEKTVRRIKNLRTTLFNSLDREWTVEQLAAEINISPSYFHSLYKAVFGISPIQDLIKMRISSAKRLLQHSQLPISEISINLGYKSPYHFSRQFRQLSGMSPSKYRKMSK